MKFWRAQSFNFVKMFEYVWFPGESSKFKESLEMILSKILEIKARFHKKQNSSRNLILKDNYYPGLYKSIFKRSLVK